MTPYRKKLESLKRAHRAARYPGDLLADVSIPSRRSSHWLSVAAAVAACFLVGALVGRLLRPDTVDRQTHVVAPRYVVHQMPPMPPMPPMPHVALSLPAMPGWPSLEELTLAYEQFDSPDPNEPEDAL